MTVRTKFVCHSKDAEGHVTFVRVRAPKTTLYPDTLKLHVDNAAACAAFEVGKVYYFDIKPAQAD